jgi:hypothetical protein
MCTYYYYGYYECGHLICVRKISCSNPGTATCTDRDIQLSMPGLCHIYCNPRPAPRHPALG